MYDAHIRAKPDGPPAWAQAYPRPRLRAQEAPPETDGASTLHPSGNKRSPKGWPSGTSHAPDKSHPIRCSAQTTAGALSCVPTASPKIGTPASIGRGQHHKRAVGVPMVRVVCGTPPPPAPLLPPFEAPRRGSL